MISWLVLIVRFPRHPSSVRVRAWRRLRALGAVALKKSVYLLPFSPDNYEQFQWLTQEVEKARGEARLLKVDGIENMKPADVIRLFQDARDREYEHLAGRYRKLYDALDRKVATRIATSRDGELRRLGKALERLRKIDFFDAPRYREVEQLRESIESQLRTAPEEHVASGQSSPKALRGRRWVTRPRPHVDRIASAWLVKRFIDPEAEFLFAPPEEFPPDAIGFDTLGAEFSHQGEDCTFETLLKRFGLRDPQLIRLAQIVHEVDLGDQKFPRDEARGIDLAIRGLLAALKDDQQVLAHGMTLFDGLYIALGDRP